MRAILLPLLPFIIIISLIFAAYDTGRDFMEDK